ncbi:hypothetical protein MPL1032_220129 [Mesorhizobium plurifarium]|uniref:Uncharacterized protein n=1 Tax=Mesorhizobium plurifarium TaxID=69974 RepID=A0A0K2VZ14_MESPL|nr:hypothetical protein MPL1032_220129 [Mesorhizobium plurifarium]
MAIGKPDLRTENPYPQPENPAVFNRISRALAAHNSGQVNPEKCQIIPDITPDCLYATFEAQKANTEEARCVFFEVNSPDCSAAPADIMNSCVMKEDRNESSNYERVRLLDERDLQRPKLQSCVNFGSAKMSSIWPLTFSSGHLS